MKKLLIGISILLLSALAYVVYMYNKPHKNVERSKAKESISAQYLFEEFSKDDSAAMERFADQVIQVTGKVSYLDLANENEPQLVLNVADNEGFIRCGFKAEDLSKMENIQEGTEISLKGICKGFNNTEGLDLLSDPEVVISKCTIIE